MIHYNKHNNAYCSAVNAQTFETIEHNTVSMNKHTLMHKQSTYLFLF